jgi:hypothetical protein
MYDVRIVGEEPNRRVLYYYFSSQSVEVTYRRQTGAENKEHLLR